MINKSYRCWNLVITAVEGKDPRSKSEKNKGILEEKKSIELVSIRKATVKTNWSVRSPKGLGTENLFFTSYVLTAICKAFLNLRAFCFVSSVLPVVSIRHRQVHGVQTQVCKMP